MTEPAAALTRALTSAYRPYLLRRLDELGLDRPPGLEAAIDQGADWLQAELDALLALPFPEQRRSPLEVFQESTRFPADALEAAGVAPVSRDPAQEASLPGDPYDLAPASSQSLGEEAWRAHLQWGAAKAAAMTPPRPTVVYVGGNLMDRTTIEAPVRAAGPDFAAANSAVDVETLLTGATVLLAVVDLVHEAADAVIPVLAAAGIRVVAFGPHVDDTAMARARALGAAQTMPRSRFFRVLPDLLPKRA